MTDSVLNACYIFGLIDGSYVAFRTTVAGPLEELGAFPGGSSGEYSDAYGITPDGNVIVGYGRNPAGKLEGFVVVIPEPATAALVFAAIVSIMVAATTNGIFLPRRCESTSDRDLASGSPNRQGARSSAEH